VFAQIFLGIGIIAKGIFHWANSTVFISNKVKQKISEHQLEEFQKGMVLPHFLLGMLFIGMGIIEEMNIFKTSIFVVIYIVLAVIPLGMILVNNKKYSGDYFLR
jgi:hypothetical protein